jgi:ribulose kinase
VCHPSLVVPMTELKCVVRMQLLWVKENLKESWAMAFRWMDLSDWLTYRCDSLSILVS